MYVYSPSGIAGPLRPNHCPGYGYVNNWRIADLWDHHQLYDVLSGGARFLEPGLACMNKDRESHRSYTVPIWFAMGNEDLKALHSRFL